MIEKKINEALQTLWSGSIDQQEFEEKYNNHFSSEEILDALNTAWIKKADFLLSNTLFIAFSFNLFAQRHLPILQKLLLSDWHKEHEDIIRLFQHKFNNDIDTIVILQKAARNIPNYIIENGDKYSYLRKIVYAIGFHSSPHNIKGLRSLLEMQDEKLNELLAYQLSKIS